MESTSTSQTLIQQPSATPQHSNTTTQPPVRRGFGAMVGTYCLDVFNDQLFKESTLLIAVIVAQKWRQGDIQLIFMLPYVLLGAYAGWLADRFSKRTIVIFAKWLELVAVLGGALGICTGNWPLTYCMIGIMGLRATIFSPAINGSIPEHFPAAEITKANGILKMFTTVAMLTGIAVAGFALDLPGKTGGGVSLGRAVIAGGIIAIALSGLLVSLGIPRRVAADPQARFPWLGPIETLRILYRTRTDRLLAVVIAADGFFWFLGSLLVLLLNTLGHDQFQFKNSVTSCLALAEVVGVAIGGVICAKVISGATWYRRMASVALALGGFLALIAAVPFFPSQWHLLSLLVILVLAGIAGGLFVVPLESFIQARPEPQQKGAIISAANFVAFTGMLIAAPVSNLLMVKCHVLPTMGVAIAGALTILIGIWLAIMLLRRDLHA